MRRVTTLFCLGLLLAPALAGAAGRQEVPVPAWSDFDGSRWGDLTLDRTTRSDFEREYSHRRASRSDVLEANTPGRTKTQLFLVFNGPGPEAQLAWMVCFYNSGAGAPGPAAFEGRYGAREIEGYPSARRAGWRLLASPDQGVTAVVEREPGTHRRWVGERVAGLIMGRPERMAALVNRGRRAPAEGSWSAADPPVETPVRDTLRAQIGQIDANVYATSDVRVDRDRLRQAVQQAAEERVRRQSSLQLTDGSDGSLTAALDVEPRQPGDKRRISLTAHVALDAEAGSAAIHARSREERSSIAADSSDQRIAEEASRLIERGIDAVARTAADQMQKQQGHSLEGARQQARLALIDFLAGAAR
jgi:hypothetical protein